MSYKEQRRAQKIGGAVGEGGGEGGGGRGGRAGRVWRSPATRFPSVALGAAGGGRIMEREFTRVISHKEVEVMGWALKGSGIPVSMTDKSVSCEIVTKCDCNFAALCKYFDPKGSNNTTKIITVLWYLKSPWARIDPLLFVAFEVMQSHNVSI
jgi:hypothetical protein